MRGDIAADKKPPGRAAVCMEFYENCDQRRKQRTIIIPNVTKTKMELYKSVLLK